MTATEKTLTKYKTIDLDSRTQKSKMSETSTSIVEDTFPIQSFYYEHCIYLPAMLGWFFFSAILSSYNKYVFGDEYMHFPCPLLMTSIHFSLQWLFAEVACRCFPEKLGATRVSKMTWKEWAFISVPCGLVTAMDVGLSNLSMVTLDLTFYTMVKSSTPIFVLTWAFLLKIEPVTLRLIGVILIIAVGEFVTVVGQVDFVLSGFLLCLSASILSGLRWTLLQRLLQTISPPLESTIVTMKIMAPSMFWSMLVISMILERPWKKLSEWDNERNPLVFLMVFGLLGGIFAISMILCEFFLILRASAIVLMIGGVIKELTTIFIGVTLFKDRLNPRKVVGVAIVFIGVICYKVVFHLQKKELEATAMEPVPTEEINDEEGLLGDDEDDQLSESDTRAGEKSFTDANEIELMNHPII